MLRMRKKDEGGSIRPIIVELRTEYDKWTVLRNKSDLREMNEYRNILEQDVSREEREKRQVMIRERKAEWELRGKTDQRRKNVEKRSQP